jgi:transposase-like protein
MSTAKRRVFNREFKLSAVERLMAGESAAALSRELQIGRSHVSQWCAHYRRHGPEGLRRPGRPRKTDAKLEPVVKAEDLATARERTGELERKIGQQQVELDFFRQALRHVGEARRPSDRFGVKASTLPSRR